MKIMDSIKNALKKGGEKEKPLEDRIYSLFEEFRSAYVAEWERLEECERLYLGKHWEGGSEGEPQPVTPIIQSTVENVKADLMDNIPEAIIRPESPEDETVARVVEALIKQNHDATSYSREYQKLAHDLTVSGYMVQEVGYDPELNNGIGGAFIRYVDNRNILFDPQSSDIQDGRAVFKIASRTIKWLEQQYPQYIGEFKADQYNVMEDRELTFDQTKSVLMIEYWWREYKDGQWRVHMAKAAGRKLLEDSREQRPEGYFGHGKYPFVVTPLFRRKGSALGYGFADMLGEQQKYADKLDQIVMKNAMMASHMKLMNTRSSGFDTDDLADWSKEVHEGDMLQGVTWFATPPLPNYILQYIQSIRQSIKEESGSNDFSRGNTASGVTAASAIAALQEASSKRSRMAARQMHEAYKDAVRMEIEVEREFSILPREVMLTVDGQQQIATFESAMLEKQGKYGNNIPIEFFISIKVQRENRWSVMAHNELILQMVQLGVIAPSQAAELMEFEGKESVLKRQEEPNAQQAQAQEQIRQQIAEMPTPEMVME